MPCPGSCKRLASSVLTVVASSAAVKRWPEGESLSVAEEKRELGPAAGDIKQQWPISKTIIWKLRERRSWGDDR